MMYRYNEEESCVPTSCVATQAVGPYHWQGGFPSESLTLPKVAIAGLPRLVFVSWGFRHKN